MSDSVICRVCLLLAASLLLQGCVESRPTMLGASVNWPPLGSNGYRVAYKKHAAKYTRHRAVVEVAPYTQLGLVTVHFLPCDQVKVSASPTYEGLSDHPYNFPRRMEVPSTCPTP